MRALARILIGLALALALAAPCLAQQSKRARPAKRKQPPAPVRQEVMIVGGTMTEAAPAEVSRVGQATVRYHPDLKHTSVEVEFTDAWRRPPMTVTFECSFGWDGREPTRPETVHWSFFSDWVVFKRADRLLVVADGKRFRFTPLPVDLQNQRSVEMDFASFEQIVKSRKVRVSLGQVVFDLKEGQREAFRDMLRTLEAPAKNP